MRALIPVLLLSLAAGAQPPAVKDFRRLRVLRDNIASKYRQLKDAEDFALKPPEEKMLIAFANGDKKFDGKPLSGKLVVTTCLKNWDAVQQAEPTDPVKRVLEKLPDVLFQKYTKAIEVPKDRKEVALVLVDALDSDLPHIRVAAFESLKLMYHTPSGFFYVVTMSKKERKEPISKWKRFVSKQS